MVEVFQKVKWSESESCSVMSDSLCPPGSSVHGILQERILEWKAIPFFNGSSQPEDWILVSHITSRFFTSEPPGKPKNTGLGSLFLLQGIFPTQELNQGLLCCRWILYQLSYQESLHRSSLSCVTNRESRTLQFKFYEEDNF